MSTLRQLKDEGWQITLYCKGICAHSWRPSWDQLIQYFGQDYDIVSRDNWTRLICEKCGHRGAQVIIAPDPETTNGMGGGYGYDHNPPMSVEEATRRYQEFHAERRRLGIKTIEVANAESRAALKAQAKAEKSGANFIGPPNPWAQRRRGRWL